MAHILSLFFAIAAIFGVFFLKVNSCAITHRKIVIKSSQRLVIFVQSGSYPDTYRQKCHGVTKCSVVLLKVRQLG